MVAATGMAPAPVRSARETQLVLMAAVIGDERLDDEGLDAFLAEARKLANQWLA